MLLTKAFCMKDTLVDSHRHSVGFHLYNFSCEKIADHFKIKILMCSSDVSLNLTGTDPKLGSFSPVCCCYKDFF